MKTCILDPGIENHGGHPSSNLGDLIIQRAVNDVVGEIFPQAEIVRYSTQQRLSREQLSDIARCAVAIVGGTNLLSSNFRGFQQWKVSLLDTLHLRHVLLLGVGWWQYQQRPCLPKKVLLKSILSRSMTHSVRDSYTLDMLTAIGIDNVVNTGCPTMWPFLRMDQAKIPSTKADVALVMLTDYSRNPEADTILLKLLNQKYRQIYLWPQGRGDATYVSQLGINVQVLEHNFEAFQKFVTFTHFDYVGTRLHGGVWCLLHERRSLVLEIDNRAREIAKDTGLPTATRTDFEFIRRWIDGPTQTSIRLPVSAINQWKQQFKLADTAQGSVNNFNTQDTTHV